MLLSLFGEISLAIIGTLYVLNLWFDSCLNFMELEAKNNDDKELPESVKHMYS